MSVENENEVQPSRLAVVWEYIWTLSLMALIVFSARSSLADWYEVPSGSMLPTIVEGDRIFVNKLAHNLRIPFSTYELVELDELHRGDIVVFIYPVDGKTDFIKRLVGLPGDEIKVVDNLLYINGKVQPRRPARPDELPPGVVVKSNVQVFVEDLMGVKHFVYERMTSQPPFGPVTVGPDAFFAMGDNRDDSSDSREWGEVPMRLFRGRALRVVLSIDQNRQKKYFPLDPRRIRFGRTFLSLYSDLEGI